MEILLLAIYSLFVWLIFFKFKLLPWNITTQVIVITIPVFGLATMILLLNVVAPSSHDARVINYVLQVVPRVSGQVLEVPVEGNVLVPKGAILLKLDPAPFRFKIRELEAGLADAQAYVRRLRAELNSARENTAALRAQLDLARTRVGQYQELSTTGAGNRFDLEQAQTDVTNLGAQIAAAVAAEAQVREQLYAQSGGDQAQIAMMRAQLANAHWELEQTEFRAPSDGYPINVQVRPGSFAAALPLRPVMTFVEKEQIVIALFEQNELRRVEPGNEVELAFLTLPGQIVKGKVQSIVWAQGQGQLAPSGDLPTLARDLPPGRYAVKIELQDSVFLAAGARGGAAIYTHHLELIHLVRKVIIRVGSMMNYLVLKLH